MWEEQKEIQRIDQEIIAPALVDQAGEDYINVSFSPKELRALLDFLAMFAYD